MFQCFSMECSLKPFKQTDDAYVRSVARRIFAHWKPLLKHVPVVSILLWVGDGSEILDYDRDDSVELEWGRYAGSANTRVTTWYKDRDPRREGLHSRSYRYIEDPPVITYGTLRRIIAILKEEGKAALGEGHTIRVGETFDPGPEFANSSFKYVRHPEICSNSRTMGNFIYANATLHADDHAYAGFPDGIPEGLPLGTFLGRQAQIFLSEMGFDYLWLSNGFGFGRETWSTTGAVFDGETFDVSALPEVRDDVFSFWRYFRAECPDFPVETRGTNMSVGIDYAKDGVPLYDMYHGGFNFLPPPNSPWAALDGDFGLELMGYLSRIADLPEDKRYLFRYYLHDPWWMNSPWYDRYQGQPHDLYMPLSCARLDEAGEVNLPTHMNILTIDNTLGDMPDNCVNESLPHILKAVKDAPDAPAPVVWVYPFREYCTTTDDGMIRRMFAGDWFVRGAINHGFPLTMVVSTDNFASADKARFAASVLFAPVPDAGSDYEESILSYAEAGGKVLFYGSVDGASERFLRVAGLRRAGQGVAGVLPVSVRGVERGVFKHDPLLGAGLVNTVADGAEVLASSGDYALATVRGRVAWVRGDVSSDYVPTQRLLIPQDERAFYASELLALEALASFGWSVSFERDPGQRSPILLYSRNNNALMLSAYLPSTTVKTSLGTPLGAPLFLGYETKLEDGRSTYCFPKAEHRECRFFVSDMKDGYLSARELPPVSFIYRRRIGLYGLRDATVRVLGEEYCKEDMLFTLNGVIDEYTVSSEIEVELKKDENGTYFEARHVTGDLVVSMKRPGYKPQPLAEADAVTNVRSGTPNYL
ncbi:MAG: hypothetical protein J6125_00755 [Clostridia bacterium]|nr:hypothetical protein [Clostridia bacterium]